MSTHKLETRKIERIQLNESEIAMEQCAKQLTGNAHLTDEQFRDLVSKGINLIQAPEKAPHFSEG